MDTAPQIIKVLEPIYNPIFEKELYESIISQFYLQSVDDTEVEKVIIEVYNSFENHDVSLEKVTVFKDQLYNGEINPNSGVKSIKATLTKTYDKKTSRNTIKQLKNIIEGKGEKVPSLQLSKNTSLRLDKKNYEVVLFNYGVMRDGTDNSDYLRVLSCYPEKVTIHDNPISDAGRTFSIEWITKNHDRFKTELMLIPEIETYLENHGYVLLPRNLRGVVSGILEIMITNNMAIMKNEIETPGFYWNHETNAIDIIDYEPYVPTLSQIESSLKLIEELAEYYKGYEDKLATTLKHALIAPFAFIKKQLGQPLELLVPYLYHYGKSGSGKTTISRIGLYFWSVPSENNDIGGTEADTIPRLAKQISESTFLKIINEPHAIFQKKSLLETMKTSAERTNARGKYEGKNFQHILALAMVDFTSNYSLPAEEGLSRRFVQLLYTHNEKKSEDERDAFIKAFRMDDPTLCRFNELKHLANFALDYIRGNTDVLRLDWQTLANKIVMQAYIRCGRQVPEWLLTYVESVTDDDLDEEETEELRMFFLDVINDKLRNITTDTYETPNGKTQKRVKISDDFQDRVFNVINEQLIPYMGIHYSNKTKQNYVYFTIGLKKALHGANQVCYDVKSIAELLGWKYGVIKMDGKSVRVMTVRFDKFMRFLYPDYSNMEEDL